jgi:hypothetical protein
MPSSSFLARVLVAGLSSAVLAACTSVLGQVTIDNSLADGGGTDSGGAAQADGAGTAEGGGGVDAGLPVDAGTMELCNATGRFVFVTAEVYPANFGGAAPIVNANATCKAAAKAGNLPGTYQAWLSTSVATQSPGNVLTVPMFLPDCTPVIQDPKAYVASQGMLDHPINQDQFGKPPVAPLLAWTGTQWNGAYVMGGPTEQTCNNWSDPGMNGTKGVVGNVGASDDKWSAASQVSCMGKAHLYCVQVK